MANLAAHHGLAADEPANHCLVQNEVKLRRIWPLQQLLACHSKFDQSVYPLRCRALTELPDDGTGILLSLQQAWNEQRFKVARDGGGLLIFDELKEILGCDAPAAPPGSCPSPPSQLKKLLGAFLVDNAEVRKKDF